MEKRSLISILLIVLLFGYPLTSSYASIHTTPFAKTIQSEKPMFSPSKSATGSMMNLNESRSTTDSAEVDTQYIYNITAALSYIIFTEYNKSQGEIAKGRAFGSKGEHKAAQILFDNMTALGLHPTYQYIGDQPCKQNDSFRTQLEVLNYTLALNGRRLECYLAGSWKGQHENPRLLNTTFSYHELLIKPIPRHSLLYHRAYAKETQDFVFLDQDHTNSPDIIGRFKDKYNPLTWLIVYHEITQGKVLVETALWYRWYPHCRGLVFYDFNPDCHDMIYFPHHGNSLPVAFISGNDGAQIVGNMSNSSLDLEMTQRLNTTMNSSNVIGELPGRDPSKTVIVSCLYDGWWDQGTADSAIGMAMVLGIAKYFIDNNIPPAYTLKFIGFCGEESGAPGAKYYAATHKNETIVAVLDLNQLGFTQTTPRLTLDFISNHYLFLQQISPIVQRLHYMQQTGNVTDVKFIWWPSGRLPGNAAMFTDTWPLCKIMMILKDGGWVLHHRDGQHHQAGDVLSYFNWTDTTVTAEIAINITLAMTTHPGFLSRVLPSIPFF